MPIYEPALSSQNSTTSIISSENKELSKLLTNWWIEGRLTYDEYLKGMNLTGVSLADNSDSRVLFRDDPISNKTTWKDILKVNQAENESDSLRSVILSSVICSEDSELIFKSNIGSPACVKPSSVQKLIERGWGEY